MLEKLLHELRHVLLAVLYGILHAPMYEHVPDLTLYSDLAMAFKIMLKIMRAKTSKMMGKIVS